MMLLPTGIAWDAAPRLAGAGWWAVLLALLLGAAAFWLYRRQLHEAPAWHRHVLPALRAAAVAAVTLMLAQPSLYHSREIERTGQIIVLADASGSMNVPDPQARTARKFLVARTLGLADAAQVDTTLYDLSSRLAAARQLAQEARDERPFSRAGVTAGLHPPEASPGLERAFTILDEETTAVAEELAKLRPALLDGLELRGTLILEWWEEVPGRRLTDIERQDVFSRPPDRVEPIGSLRLEPNAGENYVRRIRGLLYPQTSGRYTFHLSADAEAVFNLAPGEGSDDLRELIRVSERTGAGEAGESSAPVELEAGRGYAFELIHKEGERDDHLTLLWSRQGEAVEEIAADVLAAPAEAMDSLQRRDELARSFTAQVAEPARAVASAPLESQEAALREALASLSRWERELLVLFNAQLEHLLLQRSPALMQVVEAFEQLNRAQRSQRLVEALSERLRESGELEVRFIGGEEAGGGSTNLAAAIAAIEPDHDRQQALILLSDGRHNSGPPPAESATALGRRGVPIYPVLVGSPMPPRDLAVLEVIAPAAVHREDQLTGRIVLLDTMPAGQDFHVRIQHGANVLWEQSLQTGARGRREVEFALPVGAALAERLRDAGDRLERINELLLPLTVSLSELPGEMQSANNQADLPIRATLGTGRILVIDGRPRWETRYLAQQLSRDRRWDLTQVLGPGQQGQSLERGPGALPETREEWMSYDVIVLGEVPVEWWQPHELQWLADFVDERGGGLVIVDGTRGTLLDYSQTPLARLMPVMREPASPLRVARLSLTEAGANRDALRLEPDEARNTELWPSLPPPRWVVPTSVMPHGEVLAEAELADGTSLPAIVTANVGRGRVWYQAFDETWRWRRDAEDRWQTRYWSGVSSRIMEAPFAVEDQYVSLGVDQAAIEPGGRVTVRARLRNAEGVALTGEAATQVTADAVMLREGVEVARARLEPDASGGGLFQGVIEAPRQAGTYDVTIATDIHSASDTSAQASLLVRRPAGSIELARLDADETLMRQIATSSDGRFFQEYEADGLIEEIGDLCRRQTISREYHLWANWPLFVGVVGLLGLEWALRRRSGMM